MSAGGPGDARPLRGRDDATARAEAGPGIDGPSPEEAGRLLHQRQVHEVELDLQNEELRRVQAELEASRQRFVDLYDLAPVGYCTLDEEGVILEANLTAAALLDARREDLPGKPFSEFIFREDQDAYHLHRMRMFSSLGAESCELRMVKADGAVFWAHLEGTAARGQDGAVAARCVLSDITEAHRVQADLRRLSRIADQAPISILVTDPDGAIEYVNPRFTENTGYTLEEVRGRNPRILQSGETPRETYEEMWATLRAGKVWRGELRNRRKNGEPYLEMAVIAPVLGPDGRTTHYSAMKQDITDRRATEASLLASLKEKEVLLKEVHHRVKNNLQVISSLLRLEAGRSGQPDTKSVLGRMQARIQSMALLHETLYRSGNFVSVDLGAYLRQLATRSFRTMTGQAGSVRLELDLATTEVEMDITIPCGLLVNELISNSLNHAFPAGRPGEIRVELGPATGGSHLRLCVRDDGVGLGPDFEARRGQSLGLQLVGDLARQLGGALEIGPLPLASFVVTFPAAGEPRG